MGEKIRAWHATGPGNARKICRGWELTQGRLGPGVYLVLSEREARAIARTAFLGGRGEVIEVEIKTGKHIWNAGFGANRGSRWSWPHGVVKSKHPAWPRAGCPKPFTELAVRKTRHIKILKVDGRRV